MIFDFEPWQLDIDIDLTKQLYRSCKGDFVLSCIIVHFVTSNYLIFYISWHFLVFYKKSLAKNGEISCILLYGLLFNNLIFT